jgi:hypothetical protein
MNFAQHWLTPLSAIFSHWVLAQQLFALAHPMLTLRRPCLGRAASVYVS